jgi:hypothetical protein
LWQARRATIGRKTVEETPPQKRCFDAFIADELPEPALNKGFA